jgi:hypothetical protein
MKHLVIFFLALSVATAAPVTHSPEEWLFSVSFPGKPKTKEKKTSHPKADIFEEFAYFESKGRVWAAERVTYSVPIPPERIDAA